MALQAKIGRRFTFGPVEFTGLDTDEFDEVEARQVVIDSLESTSILA